MQQGRGSYLTGLQILANATLLGPNQAGRQAFFGWANEKTRGRSL